MQIKLKFKNKNGSINYFMEILSLNKSIKGIVSLFLNLLIIKQTGLKANKNMFNNTVYLLLSKTNEQNKFFILKNKLTKFATNKIK
jgi:hypothetical protein